MRTRRPACAAVAPQGRTARARGRPPRPLLPPPRGDRCGSGRMCHRTPRPNPGRPLPVVAHRSRTLPGLRFPFELGRTDADDIAGRDAGPPELGIDAESRQIALEALGGLLDLEVRLGGDPFDPAAADPERPVRIRLDAEAVPHRFDAVDDDAGRFRWFVERFGSWQQ